MMTINIHGINPVNKRTTEYVLVIKELMRHEIHLLIIEINTTSVKTTPNKFLLGVAQTIKSYKIKLHRFKGTEKSCEMKQAKHFLKKKPYQQKVKETTYLHPDKSQHQSTFHSAQA
jgi:hypothetical protein